MLLAQFFICLVSSAFCQAQYEDYYYDTPYADHQYTDPLLDRYTDHYSPQQPPPQAAAAAPQYGHYADHYPGGDLYGDYGNSDHGGGGRGSGAYRRGASYREEYGPSNMQRYERSYAPAPPPRDKVFVPVVIKKKQQKKKKILSVHAGFYVPGGTQMFGKFKDLFSCQKACEITPTCFAGDFNPWLGKCFLHSNISACSSMRSHKAVTHFKKVPCEILESDRGYVVLGVSVINGIEIKGVDTLADCIKKCATAGGGVASIDTMVVQEGQVCCHLDYDFGSHKCYFHPCVDSATTIAQFCQKAAAIPGAPINAIANPTAISITICPTTFKM